MRNYHHYEKKILKYVALENMLIKCEWPEFKHDVIGDTFSGSEKENRSHSCGCLHAQYVPNNGKN